MRNVSKEFRERTYKGTTFYQTAKIVFADGREKELGKRDFYMSGNGYSDGPGVNAFPLGEAMSKHITLLLVNDDDRFSDYDFYMASITVWLNCDLSETTESILIGTYTVTTPEAYGAQVTVEAMDDMYKGNAEYVTEIAYPASLATILRDSCLTCGVSLLSTSFSNDSFVVKEKPENITHRQLWGMIAMIAGGNARMNENNRLEIKEYDFSYFEKVNLDGGYFDTTTPYESGDDADGGDFTDWNTGDSFDGGSFAELNDFHMFYRAKIPTIATDDVVVTGIQTTIDEESYLFGSEGYVLKIDNQLITDNPEAAVGLIGTKIVGLRFRPFTIDHMAYPLAEFGDLCYVADRKGNVYQSIVTDVAFSYFGYTSISCSAEDPVRNSSQYYSSSTEAIVEARKNTKKQLTQYDLAVQQLTNLITNSFGVFKTEEKLEDGSVIYYLHDKTELSSSTKIWKMTADAFAVSSDGGKTWNAGLDSEGNAVVNVLSAIGINADWLIAGLISDKKGLNKWDLDNGVVSFESYNVSIKKNEDEIALRVKSGDVVSEVNQSAEQITLKGNRIVVESTNWTVNADGSQTCRNIDISGGNINLDGGKLNINDKSNSGIIITSWNGAKYNYGGNNLYGYNTSGVQTICLMNSDFGAIEFDDENGNYGSMLTAKYLFTNGDLTVKGTKSRVTHTEDYGKRLLYCYETPSPMFGDIGEGTIDETGKCYVFLDDIFAETIDSDCIYQVFLQPYGKGECYVVERNASYFIVEGTENLTFGWELKAVQRDYDTIRLEEYVEENIKGNTIGETEVYLYSLVNEQDTVAENEMYLDTLVYCEGSEE